MINLEEINEFKKFSGEKWNDNNPEHRIAKEKFQNLLEQLYSAASDAAQKLWGQGQFVIDSTRVLSTPKRKPSDGLSGRGGGFKYFQDYLAVTIGLIGENSEIIRYWIYLDGSRNESSARVSLGYYDSKVTEKNFQQHVEAIRKKYNLSSSIIFKNEFSKEQLAIWIFNSINSFDLTYSDFCDKLQPFLKTEIERIAKSSSEREIGKLASRDHRRLENPGYSSDNERAVSTIKNKKAENLIFYGPPGTGKTYHLQQLKEQYKNRCEFVTFHQSYGYEEFVEGLRPVLADDKGLPQSGDGSGQVGYKIEPGIFKRICDTAASDKNNRYAIFIDEINRGNISKIFGELISLIEIDKRGELEVTLAYSKKPFTVPDNVDIIGTMNTADRSLALIDTALRRRFEFKALYPDTREEKDPDDKFSAPLSGLIVGEIDVRKMLEAINNRIELLYDRDHCIGHAYFTGLLKNESELESDDFEGKRFIDLQHIFFARIRPLLEEYFFENWENIRRVLGDDQKDKSEEKIQFLQKISTANDRHLFDDGSEYERFRYRWNDDAFNKPEAYIRIYSNLKKQVSL